MGFGFDGFREFENLSAVEDEKLQQMAQLFIFENPDVDPFPGGLLVRVYLCYDYLGTLT